MIRIRPAKEQDIPVIQTLAHSIWPTAYRHILSDAQLEYMLEKMYNKGVLLEQMQKGHTFLIARQAGADIGFAGFSVNDAATGTYKLHKLYVLPSTHGKGVGKILINEVVNLVKQAGGQYLQLNVNRENKALEFYKKGGFTIKESVDIDIGNGYFMNDYFMEKELD